MTSSASKPMGFLGLGLAGVLSMRKFKKAARERFGAVVRRLELVLLVAMEEEQRLKKMVAKFATRFGCLLRIVLSSCGAGAGCWISSLLPGLDAFGSCWLRGWFKFSVVVWNVEDLLTGAVGLG